MPDGVDKADALLLDLDGVLYEGEDVVTGARDVAVWLRRERIPCLFLSNTTSRPRSALVAKLARFGIVADESQILTPPLAAAGWLRARSARRIAAFVPEPTLDEFSGFELAALGDGQPVDAVVVGDLGEGWDFRRLNSAFRLLMADPKPDLLALGMSRYWKAADGLRLDTAPFVVALAHASGAVPVVLGKPATAFFEAALSRLGVDAAQCIMIGDDLRVDVGGAQSAGIRGVLVRTGKYQGVDTIEDVEPWAVIDSIAELPDRWRALCGDG